MRLIHCSPDVVDKHYFFFSLQYPRRGTIGKNTIESWWGNTVYMKTADQQALPLRKVVPGDFFGLVAVLELFLSLHRADSVITTFSGLDRGDGYYHPLCDLCCCNFISVFRILGFSIDTTHSHVHITPQSNLNVISDTSDPSWTLHRHSQCLRIMRRSLHPLLNHSFRNY